MAKTRLLDGVQIPQDQIHRLPAEAADPGEAAERYAAKFPEHPGLLLLGCGEDGHTASLFPGSQALCESEKRFVVVEAPVEPRCRITMTPMAIASARNVLMLAAHSNKAEALRRVFSASGTIHETPARLVRDGLWFVDKHAAIQLDERVSGGIGYQKHEMTR